MDKTREIIRARRLEKYARILTEHYNIDLQLLSTQQIGFCDSERRIVINPQVSSNEFKNLILQKALTLHECGHILFTQPKAWESVSVDRSLSNIIKDGRVEEGVSRLYPKARLYFMYLNKEVLPYKKSLLYTLENRISQLILRESMKKTGAPPLPKKIHKQLKQELGVDYNWFLENTREAVETKTERKAARITKNIEEQIRLVCKKAREEEFENMSGTSPDSTENCGNESEDMPNDNSQSEEIAEQIVVALQTIQDKQDREEEEDEKEEDEEIDEEDEENEDEDEDENIQDIQNLDSDNEVETISKDEHNKDEKDIDENESEDKEQEKDENDIRDIPQTPVQFLESVSSQLEREASEEVYNESEIIKSGIATPDFSSYRATGLERKGTKRNPISTKPLDPIALRLSQVFKIIAQKGNGWSHSQTRGQLEMHKLPTIISNPSNPHVFKRKMKKDFSDLSVIILLDASGSMRRLDYNATEAAYIISKALEIGKYNVEVIQFALETSSYSVDVYGIKSFNQRMAYAQNRFIPSSTGCITPLLPALLGAEKSFDNVQSKRKVLFVVTDGEPNNGTGGYPQLCKQEINRLEAKGISVIGIMLNDGDGENWDIHNLFHDGRKLLCKDIKQLPIQMSTVIKNVLLTLKGGS